ncbi:MAG: hypothetical protein HQ575_02300 [Candidatus Omnitrophica bacterium]|nr:hypothetical protein [Candidatus Omnitrophota bacterium]
MQIGRKPNNSQHGYTLLELILLAIIITVLVGVSTPLFKNTFSDLELKDASFNLSRIIGFVQEKAILEGLNFKIVLNADKSLYYISKEDPKRKGIYERLKDKTGRLFKLPRDVKIKSTVKEITFYPDGHSQKASITLTGRTGSVTLNVKGNMGYVEVKEAR